MNSTDTSNRTCFVLLTSTVATIASLASVWIVTAATYAPMITA